MRAIDISFQYTELKFFFLSFLRSYNLHSGNCFSSRSLFILCKWLNRYHIILFNISVKVYIGLLQMFFFVSSCSTVLYLQALYNISTRPYRFFGSPHSPGPRMDTFRPPIKNNDLQFISHNLYAT